MGDSENPRRVGDAEVMHGQATVVLVLHSRWPGSAQFTPDEADALAEQLTQQAAYARELNAGEGS